MKYYRQLSINFVTTPAILRFAARRRLRKKSENRFGEQVADSAIPARCFQASYQ